MFKKWLLSHSIVTCFVMLTQIHTSVLCCPSSVKILCHCFLNDVYISNLLYPNIKVRSYTILQDKRTYAEIQAIRGSYLYLKEVRGSWILLNHYLSQKFKLVRNCEFPHLINILKFPSRRLKFTHNKWGLICQYLIEIENKQQSQLSNSRPQL